MKRINRVQISWVILLWILLVPDSAFGKKILVICPVPMYSHHQVYKSLVSALLKHGHEVVFATSISFQNQTLSNYTEIDLSKQLLNIINWNTYDMLVTHNWMQLKYILFERTNEAIGHILRNPDIQRLYADGPEGKFDLVIYEQCLGPAPSVLAYKLNALLIGITTLDLHVADRYTFGTPILSSHPSNWEYGIKTGTDLSFWERLKSFIDVCLYIYKYNTIFIEGQRKITEKYLGHVTPDIVELQRNMSVMFIEHHPILGYPIPDHPHFIKFSGIHTSDVVPKLPTELQALLDGATKGFIYMSLGTSMKSEHMPKKNIQTFIDVFSKLPYRIVWKIKGENIRGNRSNIYTMNWTPQQGILAHPNIKLFIYQGGLQSTDEAVRYAVPLLGLPCIHDQHYQVKKMVSLGVAKQLDIKNITERNLHDAISEVIGDKRYKETMLNIRDIVLDKPYDNLENIIWWIEYVMRHNGAPFLRYNGMNDPWYKRYDTDVIVFLGNIFLISAIVITYILFVIAKCLFKHSYALKRIEKQKLQ